MHNPATIRRPVATFIGLAIALSAAPVFMAVFRLVAGENRSDLQVLARELGIWLLVGALLWIVKRREVLPLSSIGLHTDRPLRSILRGAVLALMVAAFIGVQIKANTIALVASW